MVEQFNAFVILLAVSGLTKMKGILKTPYSFMFGLRLSVLIAFLMAF